MTGFDTITLLTASNAIDAGDDATCESTDQRGITRPQGDACDAGAFELETPTAIDGGEEPAAPREAGFRIFLPTIR